MEDFDKIEIGLLQEHERIIEKRKALLESAQRLNNFKKSAAAPSFWDSNKARDRNIKLNQRLTDAVNDLNRKLEKYSQESKLDILKKNYWTTVSQLFPAWYQELLQYRNAHEQKPSADTPRRSSPLPEQTRSQHGPSSQATKTDAEFSELDTMPIRLTEVKMNSRSEMDEVRMESDSPIPSSEGEHPTPLPEDIRVERDTTGLKTTYPRRSKRRKKATRFNI